MDTLPKKLASYIHDTGMRALDHLAENQSELAAAPEALRTLVRDWGTMTAELKEDFVTRVSTSVGEVIAASALLPVGVKEGKKAVKSAKKVLRKSAKTLKKNAKAAKKNRKAAKKNAKSANAKAAKKNATSTKRAKVAKSAKSANVKKKPTAPSS
ncbi:MAG TPA: hypothetical protein VF381_16245 [Thermoanaerobaculia bacterium]